MAKRGACWVWRRSSPVIMEVARTRVGSLTFACPPGTADLFAGVAGVDAVIDLSPGMPFFA